MRTQGGLPGSPGLSSESFFKLCKKCGVRWAVFVRDVTHSWYHRGVADGEGFNELLATIHKEVELVQPRELVTIGASMGGYGAVRAGLQLQGRPWLYARVRETSCYVLRKRESNLRRRFLFLFAHAHASHRAPSLSLARVQPPR